MNDDTAQMILDTTPEKVYRVLRDYDPTLFVDPGNGRNCPLHHYFCDALLMEPDDVRVEMERVELGYYGEFLHPLPQWMTDYQHLICSPPWPTTIGECLEVLRDMYPEVEAVDDEEDEREGTKEYTVEECIAELREAYGTDRDPIASAIYYLEMYAASLAYEKERN